MDDPVRDLNNYLQGVRTPSNLIPFLAFTSEQRGPNHQTVHQCTYTFRDVVVGQGEATSIRLAKAGAASQALRYFHMHGIPGEDDSIGDLNDYLHKIQGPKKLVPLLRFTSVQEDPNSGIHTGTYTFREVVVGTGQGITIDAAQGEAARLALQYFCTRGLPGGNIEPYLTPMEVFLSM